MNVVTDISDKHVLGFDHENNYYREKIQKWTDSIPNKLPEIQSR